MKGPGRGDSLKLFCSMVAHAHWSKTSFSALCLSYVSMKEPDRVSLHAGGPRESRESPPLAA